MYALIFLILGMLCLLASIFLSLSCSGWKKLPLHRLPRILRQLRAHIVLSVCGFVLLYTAALLHGCQTAGDIPLPKAMIHALLECIPALNGCGIVLLVSLVMQARIREKLKQGEVPAPNDGDAPKGE